MHGLLDDNLTTTRLTVVGSGKLTIMGTERTEMRLVEGGCSPKARS
jgi:hypothetical protein